MDYLRPLEVNGIHERALEILDPGVLPLQQTLKLKIRLSSGTSQFKFSRSVKLFHKDFVDYIPEMYPETGC